MTIVLKYKEIYSDERSTDYKFGHKSNINVKFTRGFYEFTFVTNSEGLREKEDYTELPKSVIFLGDSIIEGASVENEETMDSVFEKITGITSLNFGVSSRGVFLSLYFLKAKYRKEYNTKLIIYGFCLNDFLQTTYINVFDSTLGTWRRGRILDKDFDIERGVLYKMSVIPGVGSYVENGYKTILGTRMLVFAEKRFWRNRKKLNNKKPWDNTVAREYDKKFIEFYLNKMRNFAKEIGSEFAVIIFPMQEQLLIDYEYGERLQDTLLEILQKNQITHIDLYDVMKEAKLENPNIRLYHDYAHPYKMGHRLIGEYLGKMIPRFLRGFPVPGGSIPCPARS